MHGSQDQDQDQEKKLNPHAQWQRWAFTWNNYPADVKEKLQAFVNTGLVEVLSSGFEVAKTGTPHIQGQFVLHKKDRFKNFAHYFDNKASFKPQYKSVKHNIIYCAKDGKECLTFGPIEAYLEDDPQVGEKRKRTDEKQALMAEAVKDIWEGRTLAGMCMRHPIFFAYNYKALEGLERRYKHYKKHPDVPYYEERH